MSLVYRGPRSGLSIRVEGVPVDVPLIDGQAPEGLPTDHPIVATLQASGLLVDVPAPVTGKAAKAKAADSASEV